MSTLTMFIILRKDLVDLNFTTGPLIAQACHATSLALHTFRTHPQTQAYLSDANIRHMRKVVLECKNLSQLERVENGMRERGVDYVRWVEEPEGIVTCLATRPYERSDLGDVLKKCQLYR